MQVQQQRETHKCLQEFVHHISHCDGTVREQLREWLESVSVAKEWTGVDDEMITKMLGYLSAGALRMAIVHHIRAENAAGWLPTWLGVRAHVVSIFLDEDEAEYKR